jgi:hypothetical protein
MPLLWNRQVERVILWFIRRDNMRKREDERNCNPLTAVRKQVKNYFDPHGSPCCCHDHFSHRWIVLCLESFYYQIWYIIEVSVKIHLMPK